MAWRIAGYGGMQFADPSVLGETVSVFGPLTGPEKSRHPPNQAYGIGVRFASGPVATVTAA